MTVRRGGYSSFLGLSGGSVLYLIDDGIDVNAAYILLTIQMVSEVVAY